eukprot:Seg973.2 transcript_id=Seg973.2/GoldUCD/mRNA.D3Y31 product="DNA repair protein XRCC1" protein_id=Seg973.2/GoldUCD/D3Y31
MPRIELKHVVSFTSEDPKNPAENLLKPEAYFKWRCASSGENKAVVIIQLEKATQIHSIDIGNNGSAFVEVLAGRSTWDSNEEYKVLLVASSFMSPAESKAGTLLSRVRMFGPETLNKAVSSEKWDRIKVVCTQPYNKDEPYGLAFINLHSPPEDEKQTSKKPISTTTDASKFKSKIGRFTLKDDSEKDDISIGSYFAKRSQPSVLQVSPSVAASARDATSSIRSSSFAKSSHATTFTPKRDFVATPKRDTPAPKQDDSAIPKRGSSSKSATESRPVASTAHRENSNQESLKRKAEDRLKSNNDHQANKSKSEKSQVPAPLAKKVKKSSKNRKLPFHRLMRNVVFVLSGYKNPERSNLRDKAVSMGAQYRPDWGPGCTHLICAFKNTPKFNQVLGKGKIVSHTWIKDCEKRQERLSMKEYRMDDGSSSSDMDSDDHDEPDPVSSKRPIKGLEAPKKEEKLPQVSEKEDKPARIPETTDQDMKVDSTESLDEPQPGPSTAIDDTDSDEYDTEDELRKARDAMEKEGTNDDGDDDDEYGGSTEDETDDGNGKATKSKAQEESARPKEVSGLPTLPSFFDDQHFLLYGEFDQIERRQLNRYITAYDGVVDDYMNENIRYVISNKDWDETFSEALDNNPSLEFARPAWIFDCHEQGKLTSLVDFTIKRT